MVGYGTDEVPLHYDNFDYVNLVGKDSNSWGLSHKGTIWHNGVHRRYCEPFFDKDILVGVLLNTHDKTLHYFINGVYHGLAFRLLLIFVKKSIFRTTTIYNEFSINSQVNLENKKLYPMLSSTATDVELELMGSYKLIYSLQDLCCQKVTKICKNFDSLPLAKRLIGYLKEF